MGGDFNAHLKDWGYARNNVRGEILLDYLSLNELTIINDPTIEYTFKANKKKGTPDLTLSGNKICQYIDGWSTDMQHDSLSDHLYINFGLHISPITKINFRYKTKYTNFYKFNSIFNNYKDNLLQSLQDLNTTEELDNWTSDFHDIINFVMSISLKRKSISYETNMKWYTDNLKIHRSKLNAKYKRSKANPDNTQYQLEYKKERAKYKLAIKEAKINSWKTFCQNSSSTYGTIFKLLKGKILKNTDLIHSLLETSNIHDSYFDIEKDLMKHHFGSPETEIHEFISQTPTNGNHPRISLRELKYCISLQNLKKAPGYDNIDARMIKNLLKYFPLLLTTLYNKCLSLEHFPAPWKKGLIIFFRKKNKDNHQPSSYRPITLLPMMGKVLERIIKVRTITQLENSSYLNNAQFGFREMKSTADALNFLLTSIQQSLDQAKYAGIISFDIQGAFDKIQWQTISIIIDNSPLPQYLKNILKNYISNRYNGLLHGSSFHWHQAFQGCPQGSCLGPLLWLIIANYLINKFLEEEDGMVVYADDFTVRFKGNSRSTIEEIANRKISLFTELCNQLGLTISEDKTTAILFGRNLLKNRHPIFKVNNKTISVKNNITYLGVVLDSKLKFQDHLIHLKTKVQQFVNGYKHLHFSKGGLKSSIIKMWYNTVVVPQILYAFDSWYPYLNAHGKRKLKSIQRMALLGIIKTYRSISTDALCILTGIIPIDILIPNKLAELHVKKGNRPLIIQDTQITQDNILLKEPSFHFPNFYNLTNLTIKEDNEKVITSHYELQIYTDGSVIKDGNSSATASALTIKYRDMYIKDLSYRHHHLNSIYQAELFAIYKAISWIASSSYTSAIIFSDSHSSVDVLKLLFPRNCIIKDIYNKLLEIPQKKIAIQWIKAHAGNTGNERADLLAKKVITDNVFDEEIHLPIPLSAIKYYYNKKSLSDWQLHWSNSTKGRNTYKIINKVNQDFITPSTIIPYYLSGHGSFPAFLYKINRCQTDICLCKRGKGNIEHYIFGPCSLIKYTFKFNKNMTLRQNLQNVLFSSNNYDKLRVNYNILNKHYSFITKEL